MWNYIVNTVQGWITTARETYHVDPIVFVILLVACAPVFYYSIFRLVRALARKRSELPLWSMIFLAATVVPYLYVLIFGRNFPWWIYIVLGLLLAQGVYSLVKKLRKKPGAEAATAEDPPPEKKRP